MIYSWDKFLRPLAATDTNIQIMNNSGIVAQTINPYAVINILIHNNTIRIGMKSGQIVIIPFSNINEAKLALPRIKQMVDSLQKKKPMFISNEIKNFVKSETTDFFYQSNTPTGSGTDLINVGSFWYDTDTGFLYVYINDELSGYNWVTAAGEIGPVGATGSQGYSYQFSGVISSSASLPISATAGISYIDELSGNLWVYNSNLSNWISGGLVRGSSGTSGTSGESGTFGTSGSSGSSGTSGTDGSSGTSGINGINGIDGAVSLRWILENNLGTDPSGSGKFTVGYNANMISIILMKFAYTSLNVASEGFWNTIANSILIGSSVYLQVRRVNEQNYTALYKVNNVFWSGTSYEIGVDTPAVYGNGQWWIDNEYSVSFSIAGANGTSGTSGSSGTSGTDGSSGTSGTDGTSGQTPTMDWTLTGGLTVGATSSLNGLTVLQEVVEVINSTPAATASVVIYDFSTGSKWYHSSATTNYTANFINVPTDNNRAITTTIIIDQGATPYIPHVLQIGGTPSTIKWSGGTASGTANQVDIVGFTFIRSGNSWAQVLGQINTFD
jgi:hypothetical protein